MSRRSRPQYRLGLEWILGVAFPNTLTRPVRLAQGFTSVRCCGSPRASSPHGLTAPAPCLATRMLHAVPPARGCYHLAPQRTFTSNPVPMPGTPGRATPSRRRDKIANRPAFSNPAGIHLISAGRCPHNRGQLCSPSRDNDGGDGNRGRQGTRNIARSEFLVPALPWTPPAAPLSIAWKRWVGDVPAHAPQDHVMLKMAALELDHRAIPPALHPDSITRVDPATKVCDRTGEP